MERTVIQKKKKLIQIARRNGVSLSTVYRIQRGDGCAKNPRYHAIRREIRLLDENRSDVPGNPVLMVAENTLSAHALEFYEQMKRLCIDRKVELVLTLEKSLEHDLSVRTYSGIISMTPLDVPPDIPLIYLNRRDRIGAHGCVCIDGMVSWCAMLNHLRDTGSRRIGMFTALEEENWGYYLVAGATCVRQLQRIVGLPVEPELICPITLTKETHASGLIEVADYFASLPEIPDTILVNSDIYLPRIAKRLNERGFRIPGDILLASVYNYLQSVPSSSHETAQTLREEYHSMERIPSIYGCHYFQRMAESALELLLEKINHPDAVPRMIGYTTKIYDYRLEEKRRNEI